MMADELSRLSQVVGKEGKLKKRAALPNAHGFWADSVDCINSLIDDLVHPTSEVGRVIGAVAQGDLSKSMALEMDGRPLEGEFLRTAKTINKMVEQLGNFSAEVTRVAREVGTEGKLGGQARVKGVAGTWKDLTDSVNSMADNLTDQVRNIAEATTAVAKGDLSKKIEVDVKGEFLTVKSTINTMVDQLRSFASEVTRVAREVGSDGILARHLTAAVLRACAVKLPAMEFPESVRSFQVPATPFTLAWPPSLPSVPTSRATRVTSAEKLPSCSTILLMVFAVRRTSPSSSRPSPSSAIDFDKSPCATAPITRATSEVGCTRSEERRVG